MPYSAEVMRRARQRLADRKAEKESVYRQNLQQAYTQVPRLKQIDIQLRQSMVEAAQTVFQKGGDPAAKMEEIKTANLALQQEYRTLVEQNFSPKFLDNGPICPHCEGNGYVGSAMCSCLAKLCREEQKKEISHLTLGLERFENFRLDYYPEGMIREYGASPRKIMQNILQVCTRYTDAFAPGVGNLLFVGSTGLGKTFLSACVANEVTDKGYSVAYESAPQLFATLEKNRFNPDEESALKTESYRNCDLLILDDLGTEMPGSFVTAALYDLLNQRLLADKPMIISTNLNVDEIAKRYSGQIASRMQGSFRRLTFVGEDIRVMKARGVSL